MWVGLILNFVAGVILGYSYSFRQVYYRNQLVNVFALLSTLPLLASAAFLGDSFRRFKIV